MTATVNFNSINSCKQAWVNYVLRGNSCGYAAADIGKIEAVYADRLADWEINPDVTEYEISGEDWNNAYLNGQDDAMDATGFDGDRTSSNIKTGTDGLLGLGAVAGGGATVLGVGAGTEVATDLTTDIAAKAALKAGGGNSSDLATFESASEASTTTVNDICWMATCALTLAAGIKGKAEKANEKEAKACEAMVEVQNQTVAELGEKAQEMEDATQESQELSDEADAITEENNEELENRKTEYDMARDTIEALRAKIDSGEALTDEEKALWEECMAVMQESSGSITTIQDDTSSAVTDLNDEIAGKQESYDNVAEGMADLQGKTDYVKEFDEATEKATLWEGINQTATAAGGALAAAKGVKSALASTAVWWVAAIKFAAAAIGAAGATMCGFNAAKQFEYRGIVQNEIDTRHAAEDANTDINDMYDDNLEAYALSIDTVEDLELEVPEDMEAPEDMELPEDPEIPEESEDDNPSAPGFGLPDSNQDDDKKDKEPKK